MKPSKRAREIHARLPEDLALLKMVGQHLNEMEESWGPDNLNVAVLRSACDALFASHIEIAKQLNPALFEGNDDPLPDFEREADPDGKLDPAERARRAGHLKKAHFARMALRAMQAERRDA